MLYNFSNRTTDHPLNPLLANERAIRAPLNELEVLCIFHRAFAPDSPALHMYGSVLKTMLFIYYSVSMVFRSGQS